MLTGTFAWLWVAVLVLIAWSDVRSRKIPNVMLVVLLVLGGAHSLRNLEWTAGFASLCGLIVGIGLLFFQYRQGVVGAGDVKLLGTIGAALGPVQVLFVFVVASIVGGALSLVALFNLKREERKAVAQNLLHIVLARNLAPLKMSGLDGSRKIPFGVALSIGAILTAALGGNP